MGSCNNLAVYTYICMYNEVYMYASVCWYNKCDYGFAGIASKLNRFYLFCYLPHTTAYCAAWKVSSQISLKNCSLAVGKVLLKKFCIACLTAVACMCYRCVCSHQCCGNVCIEISFICIQSAHGFQLVLYMSSNFVIFCEFLSMLPRVSSNIIHEYKLM